MKNFPITFHEFRYLRKHKINLELRYRLKIILPEVFNHFRTIATTYGDEEETQNLRNLLQQKTGNFAMNRLLENPIPPSSVPLITLSDTECEPEDTQKKRKKKKRKTSPIAVVQEPAIDNDVESKRARIETTTPAAEDFIPLSVTSNIHGARSVKVASVTRAMLNDSLQHVSQFLPSYFMTPDIATTSTSQEADDSIVIIDDTAQDKPSTSNKNNDSVILLDDSTVEEVPRSLCNDLYVIDRKSIIVEDSVQNSSSTSRNDNDSVILLDDSTILDVPRAVNGTLVVDVPRPVALRLRPVVIDGSNVAREHGGNRHDVTTFSCRGIQISVEFFLARGHTEITVFIPKFRRTRTRGPCPTTDTHILDELEKDRRIVYTPSRYLDGRLMTCYDDRFIVRLADLNGGVILSNDNYRDIMEESESFKKTIKERLLMYCFAGDTILIPDDPLGRHGPPLNEFLTFPE